MKIQESRATLWCQPTGSNRIGPSIQPSSRALVAMVLVVVITAGARPMAAWAPAGHMVIAQIAHERLSPTARAEADRLIGLLADFEPRYDDFVTASTWLDAIRGAGWRSFDRWHYVDLPFNADGIGQVSGPSADNAITAVREAIRVLEDPAAPDLSKAFMLRVLIHVVGDLHQPLHCVSRYTVEQPDGDRGGGRFDLPEADGGNLHRLWDGALGLLPDLVADAEGRRRVPELVEELERSVPETQRGDLRNLDPEAWAREGFRLATTHVYTGLTPGRPVPEVYRFKGQLVVRRRLLVAGLRLTHLLEQLFGADSDVGSQS
ncbi:MAG: S1/P1 nuclease [Acidobacteriota bacterium]